MNWKRRNILASIGFAAVFLLVIASMVDFKIKGRFDGIFLLKQKHGAGYEITDDLYIGEAHSVLYGINLDETIFSFLHRRDNSSPSLYTEWDARNGSGFIRNFLPDGTELRTCFSRFLDESGKYPQGLFVGGGLPPAAIKTDNQSRNETGMSYFNGSRWFHIWCNVNEGIIAPSNNLPVTPSTWKFLGSRIIEKSRERVILSSSHEVRVDSVPLTINRYARFRAGVPYFLLSINIRNDGPSAATFAYVYGDEPWVGNYGSSRGNVGWVQDRLIQYETALDPKYSWAGFFDHGNSVIGEKGSFTGIANFIEWLGENRPVVYFSNDPNKLEDVSGKKVPLSSITRYIGLQWGPLTLAPGESIDLHLAIGLAGHDPRTGLPVRPQPQPSLGE